MVNLEAANKALEDRLGEVALGRMEALGGEGPAGLAKAVAQRDVAVAVLSARVAGLEAQLGAVGPAKGRGRDGRGRTHVDRIRELEVRRSGGACCQAE